MFPFWILLSRILAEWKLCCPSPLTIPNDRLYMPTSQDKLCSSSSATENNLAIAMKLFPELQPPVLCPLQTSLSVRRATGVTGKWVHSQHGRHQGPCPTPQSRGGLCHRKAPTGSCPSLKQPCQLYWCRAATEYLHLLDKAMVWQGQPLPGLRARARGAWLGWLSIPAWIFVQGQPV